MWIMYEDSNIKWCPNQALGIQFVVTLHLIVNENIKNETYYEKSHHHINNED